MNPEPFVIAAGLVLILGMFAFMLRSHPVLVFSEEHGLNVGAYVVPWESITRLTYTHGSAGTYFELSTIHGVLTVRDEQLAEEAGRLHRTIVTRAHLRPGGEPEGATPVALLPGDVRQEWTREVDDPPALPVPRAGGKLEQEPDGSRKKAAVGAGAALVLWKFGKMLLVALKGLAPLGNLLPTASTMLVTVWIYAQFWGWQLAAGFVVLILLHELGHVAVMAAKGMRTSPIVFIPFVGAVIGMKDQPRDATVEAEMAYGGPAAGALAAMACLGLFHVTEERFWVNLAYLGFFVNLFNLLPVSPLDGGRVVAAVSPWLWIVGLVLAGALALSIGHPILVIVVVLGALRAYRSWRAVRSGAMAAYFQVSGRYRALMAGAYFGLCAWMGYMMQLTMRLGEIGA